MNRRLIHTAAILLASGLIPTTLSAKSERIVVTPGVKDPGGAIPEIQARAIAAKLRDFGDTSGIPIVMIFAEKSPGEEEDKVPGAVMRALSTRLGLVGHGVLVAHFPVDDDWRVWIGNELASKFARKPGTAAELTKSGEMHEAKEAWFAEVYARADEATKALGAKEPGKKLGITADAIADGLIARLSPQSVAN